jgi:hypothetical protein
MAVRRWLVFRVVYGLRNAPPTFTEVRRTGEDQWSGCQGWSAKDAGDAFRVAVIENPDEKWANQYAVLPLEGSAFISVTVEMSVNAENGELKDALANPGEAA